jgi:ketosteroid isomerase-like protein
MPTPEESLKVAAALTRAFGARDADGFNTLYADTATIWHAATKQTQTKQENVGLLRGVFALMREARYEEVVQLPTPEGFVQHHVIRGTFTDGQPVPELYACLVVTVHNGQITALKEWFDPAQFGEVWKRLGVSLG